MEIKKNVNILFQTKNSRRAYVQRHAETVTKKIY